MSPLRYAFFFLALLVSPRVRAGEPPATLPQDVEAENLDEPTPPPPADEFLLTLGGPAPIFALPAINVEQAQELVDKEIVTLNQLVGIRPMHPARGVVLYFFQREDSEEALQILNSLSRRFARDRVYVLAIQIDQVEPDSQQEWVEGMHLDYPVLIDNYRIVSERYGVRFTPMVVIIDGEGKIHSVGAPDLEVLNATLDDQVRRIIE